MELEYKYIIFCLFSGQDPGHVKAKIPFHSIFDDIAYGMQILSNNLVKEDEVVSNIGKDNQDKKKIMFFNKKLWSLELDNTKFWQLQMNSNGLSHNAY